MKALVYDGSFRFQPDHPDPKPGPGECLVRVHVAGICATDLQIARGYMGFRGVLGHEFVGTVAAGPPTLLGKRIVAEINCVCRACDMCLGGLANHCRKRTVLGIHGRDGCFAEFVAVPERNLHLVPDGVADEEAVFVEPLAAAYQVLAQHPVEGRMNVAVLGSGRLGLLVAQVLAATGCKLIVVGRNAEKLQFCEKKGIQGLHVDEFSPRRDRDLVVECTGDPSGLELALQMVRPRGTVILKSTCAEAGWVNLAPIVIHEVRVLGSRCGPFVPAIDALARKSIDLRSMISRTFPLEKSLEAFEFVKQPNCLKALLQCGKAK